MATVISNSCLAIGTTLANKYALKTIPLPLSLLWIQAILASVVLLVVSKLYPAANISILKPFKVWRGFLPLGLTRILGALSKTACLANVDAAFYQTARGLLLPFTAILSLYFLPQTRFPPLTLIGIVLIVFGFVGGVSVDLQQSLSLNLGVALGVWSSLTTAIETVVLKHYSAGSDLHMLQLIFMSSSLAAVVYAPLVGVFEQPAWSLAPLAKHHNFIINAVGSSAVALMLSFSTWMQVKLTSPVTHTVVAATRGVLQSLLASVSFNEVMPLHRWLSTLFILGGTAVYSYSKTLPQPPSASYSRVPATPIDGHDDDDDDVNRSAATYEGPSGGGAEMTELTAGGGGGGGKISDQEKA